jgi:2,4-dienoyl-CoA reductase-like NADH-dependent reductase (Old Yellow Enzyme family)
MKALVALAIALGILCLAGLAVIATWASIADAPWESEDNQQLILPDPEMRSIVAQWQAAKDARKQYYAIPAFYGLSVEDGNKVDDLLKQAADMVAAGRTTSRDLAMVEIARKNGIPSKLVAWAMQADKLRSPERAEFKKQHPELECFADIPVDTQE